MQAKALTKIQKTQLEGELDLSVIRKDHGKHEYVEGCYVIQRLNDIFGHAEWSRSVVNTRETYNGKNAKGNAVVAFAATIVLTIHRTGATYEDVGHGVAFNPQAWDAADQAEKSAVTDGLKRCARSLGNQFGNSLYFKGGDVRVDDARIAVAAAANATDRRAAAWQGLTAEIVQVPAAHRGRLQRALQVKCGVERTEDLGVDELVEMTGRLRALWASGKTKEWIDQTLDGDVFSSLSQALHAKITSMCSTYGKDAVKVTEAVHVLVRSESGLTATGPDKGAWSDVSPAVVRSYIDKLEDTTQNTADASVDLLLIQARTVAGAECEQD